MINNEIEKPHWAIQWYDCWDLTPAGHARKDGKPRGNFATKQDAEDAAEAAMGGADGVSYKAVEVKP
jgi:hypothetical protein